jgi:hypothetical protein
MVAKDLVIELIHKFNRIEDFVFYMHHEGVLVLV